MKLVVQHFFLGLVIAFTISVLMLSVIMSMAFETGSVPVSLIVQSFILSVLCSMINLVYRSEKLKFIWQSLIGYILTVGTIMTCGLIFGWYHFGGTSANRNAYIMISFIVYSLFYLVTWIIIWKISEARKREFNDKLRAYKQKHFSR